MMHVAPHRPSIPSPRRTTFSPAKFTAAPPLRPMPKRRPSGDALPLTSLQALMPGPAPARHGFWRGPCALCDAIQRAVAQAFHVIYARLLQLLARLGLSWRRPLPAPPSGASQAAPGDPPHPPQKLPETRRARVSLSHRPSRKNQELTGAPPVVQRWRDILDLFHIKLVGMRRGVGDEPQDHWLETCRSAHFVFRSGGFVRIYLDEAGEPRVLFNNRDSRKDRERVSRIVSHLRVTRAEAQARGGNRKKPLSMLRISPTTFAAHMRVTADVAALPQWPVGRQPVKHPLPQRAQLPQLQDDVQPATIWCTDVIEEEHTCFRDWGENERLLVAVADASNLFMAQAIMDVAVRGGQVRHLRMNEALLRRYGIDPEVARTLEDGVLLQKLLSTLVASMHNKWRVQLLKRQESYRKPDAKLPLMRGAEASTCYR